jgi:hypothetical protein
MNHAINFGEEMSKGLRLKRVAFLPVYLSLLSFLAGAKQKRHGLRGKRYIGCPCG